jgi:hypothetical protein
MYIVHTLHFGLKSKYFVLHSTTVHKKNSTIGTSVDFPEPPGTASTVTFTKDTFSPDLQISEGVLEHTNARGPQFQKILRDLSYCFCTGRKGAYVPIQHIRRTE